MLTDSVSRSGASTGQTGQSWAASHKALILGSAAVLALVLGVQAFASYKGYLGPVESLFGDYFLVPRSATMPWVGLALALVGLNTRERVYAISAAVAIDLVVGVIRWSAGGPITMGTGGTWVLTAIAVYAFWKLTGERRSGVLRGVVLGALLILAAKVAETWLSITILLGTDVWDEYVFLADQALGNPSWVMGQFVDALGPVGAAILDWIYVELPVAIIVVALYQCRKGWPSHHLLQTFLLIGLIGPIFYILFPVVGPVFAFGPRGFGFQIGDFWPNIVPNVDFSAPASLPFDDAAPRNCMPSLHTAWAVALFTHSRRGPWWLRTLGTFWLLATLTATLGFGFHYGVDLIAGAVLCLTLDAALHDPERGWGWFRIRLVLGGSAILVGLLLSYRFASVQMAAYPELFGPLLVGVLTAMSVAFFATFYAKPGTALAQWGGRSEDVADPTDSATDSAAGLPIR
ncbi:MULTISPECIES: phosphatase PAP2 family protein [Rhodococcus]|uniref:phosphatase PAP2 family protein n=1 Tax=Rhodococcus globerulus TaxID=33008 RepID=UPI001C598FAA|nr:phosphatase PAP2 family protein [Rhodococcus globerulus]QXW04520.1 phosphatase PAP2 family protein [Rhodococcus globerulus]